MKDALTLATVALSNKENGLEPISTGVITGIIMGSLLILFAGGKEMYHDFDGFIKKHGNGLLWTFVICIAVGVLVSFDAGGSGTSCREWGRYASSC